MEATTSKWKCGECTFENQDSMPHCEMCDSPKRGSSGINKPTPQAQNNAWKCSTCSCLNRSSLENCRHCGIVSGKSANINTNNSSPLKRPAPTANINTNNSSALKQPVGWQCSNCSTNNGPWQATCNGCYQRHADNKKMKTQDKSVWTCSKCTLENSAAKDKCEMCTHQKPENLSSNPSPSAIVIDDQHSTERQNNIENEILNMRKRQMERQSSEKEKEEAASTAPTVKSSDPDKTEVKQVEELQNEIVPIPSTSAVIEPDDITLMPVIIDDSPPEQPATSATETEVSPEVISPKEMKKYKEVRIVLVGRTGAGKSLLANNILNGKYFQSKAGASSVTMTSCMEKSVRFGKRISIVDTPGLFDTKISEEEVAKEIAKCVGMSAPGPHAILLIIRADRFTDEEMQSIEKIKNIFGEHAYKHMIVVFTRKDDLNRDNITIDEMIESADTSLKDMISICEGRYMSIDNRARPAFMGTQVKQLITMIEDLVKVNGGNYYTNEMYKMAESYIQQREEQFKRNVEAEKAKQLEKLQNDFKNKMAEKELEHKAILAQLNNRIIELENNESDVSVVSGEPGPSTSGMVENSQSSKVSGDDDSGSDTEFVDLSEMENKSELTELKEQVTDMVKSHESDMEKVENEFEVAQEQTRDDYDDIDVREQVQREIEVDDEETVTNLNQSIWSKGKSMFSSAKSYFWK